MSVTRFEPYRDPFREFDRLLSMAASGTRAPLSMPMDVYRGEDGSYHVEADLPGADPDSVEVTVEHGVLTIQAGRTPHYGDSGQVIVAERPQGSFARQLSLGEGVDSENLTAGYTDGWPVAPGQVADFEAQVSFNLVDWATLANSLSVSNGLLIFQESSSANRPASFYRIIQH